MTREEYEELVDRKLHDFQVKNLTEYDSKLIEYTEQLKQELMAEFKEKPNLDEWKVGDAYFYNKQGSIIGTTVCYNDNKDDICDFDMFMIKHGYAKHTTEEVRFQMERDAVLYELSEFAEPKDAVWGGTTRHYFITWDFWEDGIFIKALFAYKHNDIFFATKEDAEKAIQAVGEDRIKKYYLMVGDDE